MSKNILVFGSSGHAKVVLDIIEKMNSYRIAGLISEEKEKVIFNKYKVIGSDEDLRALTNKLNIYQGIVAIGSNYRRKKVTEYILKIEPKFKFIKAIHPAANISPYVQIGEGTVIMAGVSINADTIIGNHCIINTNASVDHDNYLNDYVNISPNTATGGNVKIGNLSFIGIGCSIKHKIAIGSNAVIGAHSIVLRDIEDNILAYGIPAVKIRQRDLEEFYL